MSQQNEAPSQAGRSGADDLPDDKGAEAPEDAAAAEPAYEVGYRKPPAAMRFKPGQSGHRSGRPKGSKSLKVMLRKALAETVSVRTAQGRTRKVSKAEAFIHVTINDALKGNAKAADRLWRFTRELGLDHEMGDAMNAAGLGQLKAEDQAILARYRLAEASGSPGIDDGAMDHRGDDGDEETEG